MPQVNVAMREKKQECRVNQCNHLLPLEAQNCINECISPVCYRKTYAEPVRRSKREKNSDSLDTEIELAALCFWMDAVDSNKAAGEEPRRYTTTRTGVSRGILSQLAVSLQEHVHGD